MLFIGACTGIIETPPGGGLDPSSGPTPLLPFAPPAPVMARLTERQYRNSLEDIFGANLPPTRIEADTNPYLFYTIGASTTTISEPGAQQYADVAAVVSDVIFADPARRDAVLGCTLDERTEGCLTDAIGRVGRRLFRRPLSTDELERFVTAARDLSVGDANRGVRLAIYGMLQSPSFLYRVDMGEPDPADPTRHRYTAHELAARLSYLLWNTTPDEELLGLADSGEILNDDVLREQALRLLDAQKARDAVQAFFAQYFDLVRLERLERDPVRYPTYTPTLVEAMETELRLLVDDLVFRHDADIRGIFDTHQTFVNDELAALYGVDAPGSSPIAFVPVELPAVGPRRGILTLGAFLTMNAHPTETSPTLRGKFVRERILCEHVPPPPGDVNLNLDPMGMPATLRERLEQHRRNPMCATCHAFIDPPGLLFENFDSIGAFRTEAEGFPIDSHGDLDGVPLANGRDLASMLRNDPRVPACLVRQVYRHANARLETRREEIVLQGLTEEFARSGYSFRDLLVALVLSEGFRTMAAPEGS